jgi:hypothetical protein
MKTFKVFTRTWWTLNPALPGGREPCPGRKHTIARRLSEEEARAMCRRWNDTHDPGPLSRKAEYEGE